MQSLNIKEWRHVRNSARQILLMIVQSGLPFKVKCNKIYYVNTFINYPLLFNMPLCITKHLTRTHSSPVHLRLYYQNACTRVKHIHQRTCTSEMNYLCNNKIIVCTRDCRMKQQHTSSGMHIHAYVIDTILAKIYKSMTEMTVEK